MQTGTADVAKKSMNTKMTKWDKIKQINTNDNYKSQVNFF